MQKVTTITIKCMWLTLKLINRKLTPKGLASYLLKITGYTLQEIKNSSYV